MSVDRSLSEPRHSTATAPTGLAGSVQRVAGLQARVELLTGPAGDGWLGCADLLDDPRLFAWWRSRLADWLRAEHGAAPARTAAAYVMSWYLRVPAYAGALLWHHERRVPALRPEELALRIADEGRPHPDGLAVLDGSFYCLPSDPGSALPEATVVADEHALAEVLRARFTAHAARFVRTYRWTGPLGARTLWAAATDALDTCLWWAGREGGDEGAGVADAALVLGDRFPPLTSASTLHLAGEGTHREWARNRESCCFSYLLPDDTECAGCPRTRRRKP